MNMLQNLQINNVMRVLHGKLTGILILIGFFTTTASAQNVTNVTFTQQNNTLVITYTLDQTADISIFCSTDGGKTFPITPKTISGDVGKNISAGNKSAVWDVLADMDKLQGENVIIKVSATTTGSINGHDYVDLGLPSGLKWATCNIGASTPSDYGNYYAWGEISTKAKYSKSNNKTYKMSMGNIAGNEAYDAARANWGGKWRLPTQAEFDELIDKCTWTWTTQGGHKGYKVTGPNGNSIFLPAAGFRYGTSLYYTGEYGSYWSATPSESYSQYAYYLSFSSSRRSTGWYSRLDGLSVRPVAE